jgi:hypothetical protein
MTHQPEENTTPPEKGPPLSQTEIDAYINHLEALQRDFEQLNSRNEVFLQAWLRELAGAHLDQLLASREETLRAFSNPNPKMRRAAVHLAEVHWGMTDLAIGSLYETMALTDPDPGVRQTAIGALGSCYERTKDARIGRMLAGIIRDETLTDAIRLRAYTTLIRVHGYSDYTGTSALVVPTLEAIDWSFVQEYSKG